jgi:hypothetical protein
MVLFIQRLVLLVTLVTFAIARQPITSVQRRTTVRGASSHRQHFIRYLGTGKGDGGGKGGKNKGGNKSGRSPKSDGNAKHKGDDDDGEVDEPHSDTEELPKADGSGGDESGHKSPKGGPRDKEDKVSHKDKGGEKVADEDEGTEKGLEHFQHGEYEQRPERQISSHTRILTLSYPLH